MVVQEQRLLSLQIRNKQLKQQITENIKKHLIYCYIKTLSVGPTALTFSMNWSFQSDYSVVPDILWLWLLLEFNWGHFVKPF